jgi:membrane protein implicated in regulation of membrane protease activity
MSVSRMAAGSASGGETVLRWVIPGLGLALATLFGAVAWWVAPAGGAPGFQPRAEITGTFLSLASSLFSAAVVSFLISEYWRRLNQRRTAEDRHREQQEADAKERQRLVGELRDVHAGVKTAQLRIRAHKSVRTYGNEIRDVIMPKIAQLGALRSDVKAQCGRLIDEAPATAIDGHIATVMAYLTELTSEFENKYLAASSLQEVHYQWRQHRVAELVRQNRFDQAAPALDDLPEKGASDVWRSHLMHREKNGAYLFPRLTTFVEDSDGHRTGFSTPLRSAMDQIERNHRNVTRAEQGAPLRPGPR